jgi:hypothetical protein
VTDENFPRTRSEDVLLKSDGRITVQNVIRSITFVRAVKTYLVS